MHLHPYTAKRFGQGNYKLERPVLGDMTVLPAATRFIFICIRASVMLSIIRRALTFFTTVLEDSVIYATVLLLQTSHSDNVAS